VRGLLTYGSYRFLGALSGWLPPWAGYRLAGWLGWLLYLFSPRLRQTLASNLCHILEPGASKAQIDALVRRACVHIAKGHYDLFRIGRISRQELQSSVQIEGWEHLQQKLTEGRGVIIVSAHLGNVELVMQLLVARGVPTTAPVMHTKPERLFQYTRRLRQSHGLKLIPSDETMIGLFRALKRGEAIGLAADRDTTNSGRVITFFGEPTRLPDGPVRIALRTGAPIVPAFAMRQKDNGVQLWIEPSLELIRTGNLEADIRAGMEMVTRAMERYIGRYPEQWLVATSIWPAAQPCGNP